MAENGAQRSNLKDFLAVRLLFVTPSAPQLSVKTNTEAHRCPSHATTMMGHRSIMPLPPPASSRIQDRKNRNATCTPVMSL